MVAIFNNKIQRPKIQRLNQACRSYFHRISNPTSSDYREGASEVVSNVRSLANSDPLLHGTVLTLHEATPMKLASASFDASLSHDVVTSVAAEATASVSAGTGLVASPTGGPWNVRARVPLAEIRRLLVVKQLLGEISRSSFASATVSAAAAAAVFPLPLAIRPPPSRAPYSG